MKVKLVDIRNIDASSLEERLEDIKAIESELRRRDYFEPSAWKRRGYSELMRLCSMEQTSLESMLEGIKASAAEAEIFFSTEEVAPQYKEICVRYGIGGQEQAGNHGAISAHGIPWPGPAIALGRFAEKLYNDKFLPDSVKSVSGAIELLCS